MSALTERIAREHRSWSGISCDCGYTPGLHESLNAARTRHLIEVTEAAVRAAVVADIRAEQFSGRYGTKLAHEVFDIAARIAEGKQP